MYPTLGNFHPFSNNEFLFFLSFTLLLHAGDYRYCLGAENISVDGQRAFFRGADNLTEGYSCRGGSSCGSTGEAGLAIFRAT